MNSSFPGLPNDLDAALLTAGRVRVEHTEPVVTITLDRPDIRNAQLPETWEALAHISSWLPSSTRVVVVRGAGQSFSAGLDRSAFRPEPGSVMGRVATLPAAAADALIENFQQGFAWLSDPAFISVAVVQGHAIGAGFQLALACDLILAADDASFAMAEVTLGLVPDLTGTRRLIDRVGTARALELCATGRRLGAQEAERIGIALVSVPAADLDRTVIDLTAALLANDAEAVRAVTRLITGSAARTVHEQLAAERAEQVQRIRTLAAGLR